MILSLIAAASDNDVLGADNHLIWTMKSDTAFFMRTTMGHTVIMGRRTYDSMGSPLKERKNIVISSNKDLSIPNVEIFSNLGDALKQECLHAPESEVFVIGGAQLYQEALRTANRIYLTRVHATLNGDTYMPKIDFNLWNEVNRKETPADERNDYPASYLVYERLHSNTKV